MRCPKFAYPLFRSANFDRGTRFRLAQSAFRGARQRAPRHAPPAECSIINTVQKVTSTATAVLVSLAGAEGLIRLRCPKFACPLFRSANFDRGTRFRLAQSAFRGARQRAPRHAPPAECSIINTVQKVTSTATAVLVSLAGAEGLEPSARGFGELTPLCKKSLFHRIFQVHDNF